MSFAKELYNRLIVADVMFISEKDLTEFDRGQINMLNRVLLTIQEQLLREVTHND